MYRWTVLYAALLVLAFAALSCSSGGVSPVTPTTTPELSGATIQAGQSQTHLWGYYDCYIDLETMTVEAVENRSTAFAANVVQFVNGNPANLKFNIKGTPMGTDYIDVDIDVSITHPFPGMSKYDGYDVRGIFIGDGSGSLDYSSDYDYPVLGKDQCMLTKPGSDTGTPDGYTRWYNRKEFGTPGLFGYTPGLFASNGFAGTASLCPYKYFADGLSVNKDLWTFFLDTDDDGVFGAGKTNTRNYYLRFPNAKGVVYGYAIVANWIDETTHPANAPEAVGCDVHVTDNIYYVDDTNFGGDLILDVSLWAWLLQPDTIYIDSNMFNDTYTFDATEMIPTGGTETYSTYHVEIPADVVEDVDGNEFWVIGELNDFDYKNDLGITNSAGSDKLAAFFRYDVFVADVPYCSDVEILGIDMDGAGGVQVQPDEYIGVEITGTGFDGATGVVEFQGASANYAATNVVSNGTDTIICDVDLSTADIGFYDVYVENECGESSTAVGLIELVCPSEVYYTSFAAAEGESGNWSRTNTTYWACNWFMGEICDSNSACSTYGTPHYYAWRTAGFTVPSCWSGTVVVTMTHSAVKQEYYYDRGRVEISTNSVSGPWSSLTFPTQPYASHGWWEYSWSSRTITADISSLVSPGDTFWLRFDSYSLDSIGNSATGWHITELTID